MLENVIRECRNEIEETNTLSPERFGKLREVAIHYAKKGDLLYPHLKVKYGISGPSDVMWTTDDEIRDELAALAKQLPVQKTEDHWLERFRIVLQRVEDMIYKEANIFFPNCALNFTEEEWFGIYRDSKDYPVCFGVENATWEAAEKFLKEKSEAFVSKKIMGKKTDEIIMPGGHLTVAQLTAMLNTIPMEITFVDEDNINRFSMKGQRISSVRAWRSTARYFPAIPRKWSSRCGTSSGNSGKERSTKCRSGWRKRKTMLVTYMAVRDAAGTYLGTMELVQDMGFAKSISFPT